MGRGNCGDEAMFQVIHETFSRTHDIVAAVDEHGAHPGFWDWYPYNRSGISHQANLTVFDQWPVAGLLVGGGGLPSGFAGNLVDSARASGIPTAFAGIDVAFETQNGHSLRPEGIRDYLARFDYVGARSAEGAAMLGRTGIPVQHAAEWALSLETDRCDDLLPDPGRVAVVLREWPLEMVGWHYIQAAMDLIEGLRARGFQPCWLPFCPEDERFLGDLALGGAAPVERIWWNPRRMKQFVATSATVVSVGRLHPLVFAAATNTPAVSVTAPEIPEVDKWMPKLRQICKEFGIAEASHVGEALDFFDRGLPPPPDAKLVAASRVRLDGMISRLSKIFV
jgi:hypothetical protein